MPSNQSSESQHDSAFFEAFFDSLPQVRELFDRHEKLLEGNERLAGELALGRSRNGILRIEMRKLEVRGTRLGCSEQMNENP